MWSASWMGTGLIVVILLLSIFLPRPDSDYSMAAWADSVDSLARRASKYAMLLNDSGEGEGDRRGRGETDREPDSDQEGRGSGKKDGSGLHPD